MKKFNIGDEIKVLVERQPIYASKQHSTYKESSRILIIDKILDDDVYYVKSKGKYRMVSGVKLLQGHKLDMLSNDHGNMYNSNSKYIVTIVK